LTQQNSIPSLNLMGTVLKSLPPEAQITRVEYEGPRIALYTRNPRFLQQNGHIISEIVNNVKKRVVVRTDKSIRKNEDEAKAIVEAAAPAEAEVSTIFLDPALGEIIIEAKVPKALTQESGFRSSVYQ